MVDIAKSIILQKPDGGVTVTSISSNAANSPPNGWTRDEFIKRAVTCLMIEHTHRYIDKELGEELREMLLIHDNIKKECEKDIATIVAGYDVKRQTIKEEIKAISVDKQGWDKWYKEESQKIADSKEIDDKDVELQKLTSEYEKTIKPMVVDISELSEDIAILNESQKQDIEILLSDERYNVLVNIESKLPDIDIIEVEPDSLPAKRDYDRDAWVVSDGAVEIDANKQRECLRSYRDAYLKKLDMPEVVHETSSYLDATDIKAAKQILRDLPNDIETSSLTGSEAQDYIDTKLEETATKLVGIQGI